MPSYSIVRLQSFEVLVSSVQRGSAGHPHPVLTLLMHKLTRRDLAPEAAHGLLQVIVRFFTCGEAGRSMAR